MKRKLLVCLDGAFQRICVFLFRRDADGDSTTEAGTSETGSAAAEG